MNSADTWRSESEPVPVHIEVCRAGGTPRKAGADDDDLCERIHALIATLPIIEDGRLDFSAHAVRR
jgi:hypothetical protein